MAVLRNVWSFNQAELVFPELPAIPIRDDCAWDDFQNAIHIIVARKLELPVRFVVLVWPPPCGRGSPQAGCSTVCVVLSPPEHDIPDDGSICFCCAEPCGDADVVRDNAVGSR